MLYNEDMIREFKGSDREALDKMQFELQKYFSEIDQTRESLPYKNIDDAHQYMQKMLDDVTNMNGKVFVAEESEEIVGFIQGVIIEHKKGEDEIHDLSHNPSKEGWIGLFYVRPEHREKGVGQNLLDEMKEYFKSQNCTDIRLLVLLNNTHAIEVYKKNGFIGHNLEMILKI